MKLRLIATMLLAGATASAAPPSTCAQADPYSQALCAYQRRQFADAEARLSAIVEQDEVSPHTLKAMYFLARTFMKTGRFSEAAGVFVRIYETDRPFYDAWNCDFLLGECRRAMGKG
jgi:TolA-binding protein